MALNLTPNANDRISDTQPLILQNFTTLNTAWNVNHVEYGTANQGKHNFVTFPVQNPAPVITYPDVGLYSFADIVSGLNQLFYRRSNSLVPDVPMTACRFNVPGYAYFASGILVKWGSRTANGAGLITFENPADIPVFANIYCVIPIPRQQLPAQVGVTNLTPTSFTVSNVGNNQSFDWVAIGRP